MYKTLHFLLFTCVGVSLSEVREVFNVKADDIFETIIGDVYKTKDKLISRVNNREEFLKSITTTRNMNDKHTNVTKRSTAKANKTQTKKINITMEDIARRRRKILINSIMLDKNNPIPDFERGDDSPLTITRRFDKILENVPTEKQYLRQEYFDYENRTRIAIEKNKTISLMEHFVYATRYKLPYSQRLREKYLKNVRYKIGYLFSLLRILKQQQKIIYSTLVNYYTDINTLVYHIKMYERVIKLNVDIQNVIRLLKRLEYERIISQDPLYFDEVVVETKKAPPAAGQPGGRLPIYGPPPDLNQQPIGGRRYV